MRVSVIPNRLKILAASTLCVVSASATLQAGVGGGYSSGGIADRYIARLDADRTASADHLQAGHDAMSRREYDTAVESYRAAVEALRDTPMTANEYASAVNYWARAVEYRADELAKSGRRDEARVLAEQVLQADPDNARAQRFLERLEDPKRYNPILTPQISAQIQEVTRLLQTGDAYLRIAYYDEAIKEFEMALRYDPYNEAARRGMERAEKLKDQYYDGASRDYTRAHMIREVDQAWEIPVPALDIKINASQPEFNESSGKVVISKKLNDIIIPELKFEKATLAEVIEFLRIRTKELDVLESQEDRKGVNIIVRESVDTKAVVELDIQNLPLAEVLRYITESANAKFKVEPYAVLIVPATDTVSELFTRTYKVPPDFLTGAAASADAVGGGAAAGDIFGAQNATSANTLTARPTAKQVLEGVGIPFPDNSSATFIAASSTLVVRNTASNLDLVETYVNEIVNRAPRQVSIMAKFVEVSQRDTEELGFDWLLGAFNVPGSDRVFSSGGTGAIDTGDYPFVPAGGSAVGRNPMSAGLRFGNNAIAADSIDGLIAGTAANAISPGIFGIAGVFTDPEFQVVIRALSQHKGIDLMSAPSVTTKSGQRAQIQVIREFIYPTEFDPPQIPQDFGANNLQGGFPGGGGGLVGVSPAAVSSFPVTPTTPTTFEMRPVGVSMEVEPTVSDDGLTIDLNMAPEVIEFEGFINYGSPIQTGAVDALGNPVTVVLTDNRIQQPVFSARKVTTIVTVWDGQTVALGGLIREDVQTVHDKVPILGDLPLVGRLFQTKAEEHYKRNLMIFVTARLIDPAGQPLRPTRREPPPIPVAPSSPIINDPILPPMYSK